MTHSRSKGPAPDAYHISPTAERPTILTTESSSPPGPPIHLTTDGRRTNLTPLSLDQRPLASDTVVLAKARCTPHLIPIPPQDNNSGRDRPRLAETITRGYHKARINTQFSFLHNAFTKSDLRPVPIGDETSIPAKPLIFDIEYVRDEGPKIGMNAQFSRAPLVKGLLEDSVPVFYENDVLVPELDDEKILTVMKALMKRDGVRVPRRRRPRSFPRSNNF